MAKDKAANNNGNNSSKKTCFFITPIGTKDSEEFKKLEGISINVIEPILEKHGYQLIVAHKIKNIGSIGDQVFNRIRQKSPILYRWVMNAVRYEGYRW